MIVTNLGVDDVLAFELDQDQGGNRGLIRITAVEPGIDANDYIEVEVLVVK